MPYPFSRGVFVYGEPVRVGRDAGDEEMEGARKRLEDSLVSVTERADGFFG